LACGNTTLLGDFLKLTNDCAEDTREDDTLHMLPRRVVDGKSIRENVVGKVIALQGEQNLIAPVGVYYRRRVQNS
jgi:hypothetical protein